MLYYIVSNGTTAKYLNRECLKITYPEPFDQKVRFNKVFIYAPHLLDTKYGWYISFPENSHRPVNWLVKLICKAKGFSYNLSNEDKKLIKNSFSKSFLENYKRIDGTYPYKSGYDLLGSVLGYWEQFSKLFPNPQEREEIRNILIQQDKVPLYKLMPSYAKQISGEEFLNLKYTKIYINSLTLNQLQSDRFPFNNEQAKKIIQEREKEVFESLNDLYKRCNIQKEEIEILNKQLQEGSLGV